MKAARLRAQVRTTVARKKKKNAKGKKETSLSAPKVASKGATKRKGKGKDDYLSKKVSVTPREKPLKKPSPPNLKHGPGKELMTTSDPATQDPERCLLTHKDYALEMMESIIRDKYMDPCAE